MSVAVADSKKDWVTLGIAARELGVSVPTVRLLIRDGKLSTRIIGYWTRVRLSEVQALDRESVQPATAGDE